MFLSVPIKEKRKNIKLRVKRFNKTYDKNSIGKEEISFDIRYSCFREGSEQL